MRLFAPEFVDLNQGRVIWSIENLHASNWTRAGQGQALIVPHMSRWTATVAVPLLSS